MPRPGNLREEPGVLDKSLPPRPAEGRASGTLFVEGLPWEELELPFEMDEDLSAPPRRLLADVPEDEGEQLLLF